MTVAQNVAYGLEVQGRPRHEIAQKTAAILDAVELSGFAERYPGSLSGGQQQRVALARSLVMEPRALLFDEPLSNLDSKLRESMRRDLRKLVMRIGLTAVYVTHDQSEAMVLADRIILMKDGQIEQEGAPRDMYLRPRTAFAASFVGSANFFDAAVIAQEQARAEIELAPGMRMWAPLPADFSPPADGRLRIAVRPERIAMQPGGDAGDALSGTIVDAEFLGSTTSYAVRCGPLEFDVQSSDPGFGIGQPIRLGIAEQDLIVLAE
jgi:ABC-type Fe3+/spermidine/putrescine transport system ATPase subunit